MNKTTKIYNKARIGTDFPIIGPDYPIETYYDGVLDNLMALDIELAEFAKTKQARNNIINIMLILAEMKDEIEEIGMNSEE